MDTDTADKTDNSGEGQAQPQAERAPRDNRVIVSGVQVLQDGAMRTISGSTTEDHDALEKALTPAQVQRLKASGALEGDWQGLASPPAPMPGSRAVRSPAGGGSSSESAEVEALRAENARLRQQVAAASGTDEARGEDETPADEQKRKRGRHAH